MAPSPRGASCGVGVMTTRLDALGALEFFENYKVAAITALELEPGVDLLEVGIGTGTDLSRTATINSPGLSVGVDIEMDLLVQATQLEVPFRAVQANGAGLPFADGSFDRCRIDRVLAIVEHPELVMAEISRVVRGGGRCVIAEPDFGLVALAGIDPKLAEWFRQASISVHENPFSGRQLMHLMAGAGFVALDLVTHTFVTGDLLIAAEVLQFAGVLETAVALGVLDSDLASEILAEIESAGRTGALLASIGGFGCSGVRRTGGMTDD